MQQVSATSNEENISQIRKAGGAYTRRKGAEMKQVTAGCRFCGQFLTFEAPDSFNTEDCSLLSDEAVKHCNCKESANFRAIESARNSTEKYIDECFEGSPVARVAKEAIMPVINGDIESITIDAGLGVKLNLKTSSKKYIKAKYTVTKQTELES